MFKLLVTLTFLVAPAIALPSLSLRVSGPRKVEGIENLKLLATITNTCNETLKLLNDPVSPLSKLPAQTFWIEDAAGNRPQFTGMKVKYIPSRVALLKEKDFFTVLAPGESVDVEHDCMVSQISM